MYTVTHLHCCRSHISRHIRQTQLHRVRKHIRAARRVNHRRIRRHRVNRHVCSQARTVRVARSVHRVHNHRRARRVVTSSYRVARRVIVA